MPWGLCLPLIRPIGSRRSAEVFVMEPTHAGHLHHPALARRLHTPWLGGLQCSRHRLPSGPFSRRFFRCSLCYGPRGCSPSWTDPTLRDVALRPPRTFLPELSRGRSPFPRVGYRYTAPGDGHRDRTFTGWSTAVTGCAFWRRTGKATARAA